MQLNRRRANDESVRHPREATTESDCWTVGGVRREVRSPGGATDDDDDDGATYRIFFVLDMCRSYI